MGRGMTDHLVVINRGQEIRETNYWDSIPARAGYFYLSWNAGAGRLLVPDCHRDLLAEMNSAKYVIVSRGPWPEQGGREGLEVLFEDGSDTPFVLQLVSEQCDRLPPDENEGSGFEICAWTREGIKQSWPGKYRRVSRVPCLQPWSEH